MTTIQKHLYYTNICYALIFEAVPLKKKHQFFILDKFQKLNIQKLQLLFTELNLLNVTMTELKLGTDDSTSYISINIDYDFITKLQKWTSLAYPTEIFFKKIRKTDFPDSTATFRKNKYMLVVASTTKRALSWYKDIYLFFLYLTTNLFLTESFLYFDRQDNLLKKLSVPRIKEILVNNRKLLKNNVLNFWVFLFSAKIMWLLNLTGLNNK